MPGHRRAKENHLPDELKIELTDLLLLCGTTEIKGVDPRFEYKNGGFYFISNRKAYKASMALTEACQRMTAKGRRDLYQSILDGWAA